jgi:hypothetical protein
VFKRAFHWSISWARWNQSIPSYFTKIHLNIILPPTSRSALWSLFFWFPHQNPLCIPPFPHACYMLCAFYPPWLDHYNYIWRSAQVKKLLSMQFFLQYWLN